MIPSQMFSNTILLLLLFFKYTTQGVYELARTRLKIEMEIAGKERKMNIVR